MIVASLLFTLAATPSTAPDPIGRAFGVRLLGPESELPALGFKQRGPFLKMYWHKSEPGFFPTIEVITQNSAVKEINGWKHYNGSDNTKMFADCAADAQGVVEVIRNRHPALEAIDIHDDKQDELNGAWSFRQMLSIDKSLKDSSVRKIGVICTQSYYGVEDEVDLWVSYRLSDDETRAANARSKALRREQHHRRVISEGVRPTDF